ncbi:transmembrane protein 181-like [Limulus polyphemus]|uniref:Transmembrane protein 181-like n=1 Tax=Limulus polyphemus TaxID=6850 RepID=A0ABM1SFJ3_LIMPO|nr:transmembrane protein 181-like [Limulus polyphemus]
MPHHLSGFNPISYTPAWKIKLGSCLSQFSDFGRFIAPTYYHDRCERSVQMRLYSMHKREFVLVFAAFFACFLLCVFIGLAGPPITSTVTTKATELTPKPNQSIMATGPFVLKSPTMSTYSQQLWVIAQIVTENDDNETFYKPFRLGVTLHGVSNQNKPMVVLDESHSHDRVRKLYCASKLCDGLTLLHLGFLDFSHYVITIRFYDLESTDKMHHIQDIIFNFKSYNPAFTQVEIWFRFVFLLLTFFITCWFAHSLRHFVFYDWSIEQKWMSVLLPLLLLYNDPVFPLSFLINSWVPGMLDAMFQASFLCALLLFWLCVYHGIRQNERLFLTFYLPKFILVGLLWLAAFTLATWQKFNELRDPTYNYKVDTGHFMGFKVFFFIIGGVYVIYLLYLIIRAYTELRSMPFFEIPKPSAKCFCTCIVSELV